MTRLELLKNDGFWVGIIEAELYKKINKKQLIKTVLKYKNELIKEIILNKDNETKIL